ncbi:MAG: glycosyl hydrolase family 18 protein [Patescibacteria group bacterium]
MASRAIVFAFVLSAIVVGFGSATYRAEAATKPKTPALEVSGWLPYWRKATSTADALVHLSAFTEINPFGYTVKNDGTLNDAMKIDEAPWPELIAAAKAKKVRVIPTVMWSNGEAIHQILSNSTTRVALEDAIAALVKEKGFDGIDIDFEGKKAETKPYFATFLKGLYQRMGNKWVMCDIEARTPVSSRYDGTPPPDAGVYANDFVAINKYCDRVHIMTYDQGSIDVKLTKAANGTPYVPVADPKWVEKVVNLAAQTISKKKIVIGVATYGYEYKVTPLLEYGYKYELQWAFNQKYAFDIISQYQASVQRNSAGEMSFTYIPNVLPSPSVAANTDPTLNLVPVATTSYSDGSTAPANPAVASFNVLWWSDAKAIQDKIALAKKLGVRGIAIFKIDGGEDPSLWDVLKKI